jgi:hypothetical protein
MNHSWIDPRVAQVKVAGAKAYLLRHGWRPKPVPRPEVLLFEGPMADDGTPLTQVLPAAEHFSDYRMRMEDLIGTLGALENRYAVEILDEMLALPATNGAVEHSASEGVEANGR